jgi:hypothetical protein
MRIGVALDNVFISLLSLMLLLLSGCQSGLPSGDAKLKAPEETCKTSPASWQGIMPGRSTKSDVVNILGQPIAKQHLSENKETFLYPPFIYVPGDSRGNSIVFRPDGAVDWIDVWVSNSDGKFHTVFETVEQYGSNLDVVYANGVADMSGPDQVYVWSECGIAITAVDKSYVRRSADEILPLAGPVQIDKYQLTFRHPVLVKSSYQTKADVNDIVVRQFLFQPTSFDPFREFYADWIPYLQDERFFRPLK